MSGGDWQKVHGELVRLARSRAALDAEEASWLVEAIRVRVYEPLGFATLLEYLERLLGYGPRLAKERLRVAEALSQLPSLRTSLAQGALPWSAVREVSRVATPATEAEWIAASRGKTVRQIEEMVSGRRTGDRPGDPADPKLRRHVLRLEISADALAAFREARRHLELEVGHSLEDDEIVRILAHSALDGGHDPGRAPYQVAMTVCTECRRGTRDGAGQVFDVGSQQVDAALCDAQLIYIDCRAATDVPDPSLESDAGTSEIPPDVDPSEGLDEGASEKPDVDPSEGLGEERSEILPAIDPSEMRGEGRSEIQPDVSPSEILLDAAGTSEILPDVDPSEILLDAAGTSEILLDVDPSEILLDAAGTSEILPEVDPSEMLLDAGASEVLPRSAHLDEAGPGAQAMSLAGGSTDDVRSRPGAGRMASSPATHVGRRGPDVPPTSGSGSRRLPRTAPALPRTGPGLPRTEPGLQRAASGLRTDPALQRTDPGLPRTDPGPRRTDPGLRRADPALPRRPEPPPLVPAATQTIPPRIRRFIWRRDRQRCKVPGCRAARYLEIHHLVPLSEGGDHDPSRMLLICWAHHTRIHTGRLRIEGLAPDQLVFTHANGAPYGEIHQMMGSGAIDSGSHRGHRAADGMEADAVDALRRTGVSVGDARRAVAEAVRSRPAAIEDLIRQAFVILGRTAYASRVSERQAVYSHRGRSSSGAGKTARDAISAWMSARSRQACASGRGSREMIDRHSW